MHRSHRTCLGILGLAALVTCLAGLFTVAARQGGQTLPFRSGGDLSRKIGQSADVAGYRVTVTKAFLLNGLNQLEDQGFVVANVTIVNRTASTHSYNTLEYWHVVPQSPIVNGTGRAAPGALKELYTALLLPGEQISGQVVWLADGHSREYSLVFRPPGARGSGAVWHLRPSQAA